MNRDEAQRQCLRQCKDYLSRRKLPLGIKRRLVRTFRSCSGESVLTLALLPYDPEEQRTDVWVDMAENGKNLAETVVEFRLDHASGRIKEVTASDEPLGRAGTEKKG